MSQVKSSRHSPHCIEHSPYPPCVPTCRVMREFERAIQEEMIKPIAMDNIQVDPVYENLFLEPGKLLPKQEFGPLPKKPFQPLGHGPAMQTVRLTPDTEVHSLAITEPNGDLYATFDSNGKITGGAIFDNLRGLEAEHAKQRKEATTWMRIAVLSWFGSVISWVTLAGNEWWGW